jgi:hypothetical protein
VVDNTDAVPLEPGRKRKGHTKQVGNTHTVSIAAWPEMPKHRRQTNIDAVQSIPATAVHVLYRQVLAWIGAGACSEAYVRQ